jgi:hypothetical protein
MRSRVTSCVWVAAVGIIFAAVYVFGEPSEERAPRVHDRVVIVDPDGNYASKSLTASALISAGMYTGRPQPYGYLASDSNLSATGTLLRTVDANGASVVEIMLAPGNDALMSFDGGVSFNHYVKANTHSILNMSLPASTGIYVKMRYADANFALGEIHVNLH